MIRATEELGQETVAAGAVPTGSLVPYCAHQIIYFSFWAQIMFIFTMLVCCSLGNGEGTEGTGRTELVSDQNKKADLQKKTGVSAEIDSDPAEL